LETRGKRGENLLPEISHARVGMMGEGGVPLLKKETFRERGRVLFKER